MGVGTYSVTCGVWVMLLLKRPVVPSTTHHTKERIHRNRKVTNERARLRPQEVNKPKWGVDRCVVKGSSEASICAFVY